MSFSQIVPFVNSERIGSNLPSRSLWVVVSPCYNGASVRLGPPGTKLSPGSYFAAGVGTQDIVLPVHLRTAKGKREVTLLRGIFGRKEEHALEDERLAESLTKTRSGVMGRLGSIFQANEITPELWDEVEETLILADVGMDTTMNLVESTRKRVQVQGIKTTADAFLALQAEMVELLEPEEPLNFDANRLLNVILLVGVNGSGKTTTAGKLAKLYKNQGQTVVLAAGDTFRAAAIDQLKVWGERAGVDVIAHEPGSDPGAVVYDAIRASQESRHAKLLLVDTAGRLQTKYNLMQELEKIKRVAAKQVHRAPHEVLLVLDASTGQNAISQAKSFKDSAGVTGIVLTKLDGTSKGGSVLSIKRELGVPVRFVATGEGIDDFAPFDPVAFVEGLMAK